MAPSHYQYPYRSIQDIPEDREILLSPDSTYTPVSAGSARRPSIETAYFTPERPLETHATERWEPYGRKINPTPTQRYEKVAQKGIDDAYTRMRKKYRNAMLIGQALAVLQMVLAGVGIAVTDTGKLQSTLIWETALAGITLVLLAGAIWLARIRNELKQTALMVHTGIHVASCIAWIITAAIIIGNIVDVTSSSYSKTRRVVAEVPAKTADVIEHAGLVPAAGGFGFVMAIAFGAVVNRVSVLLRHAMI